MVQNIKKINDHYFIENNRCVFMISNSGVSDNYYTWILSNPLDINSKHGKEILSFLRQMMKNHGKYKHYKILFINPAKIPMTPISEEEKDLNINFLNRYAKNDVILAYSEKYANRVGFDERNIYKLDPTLYVIGNQNIMSPSYCIYFKNPSIKTFVPSLFN